MYDLPRISTRHSTLSRHSVSLTDLLMQPIRDRTEQCPAGDATVSVGQQFAYYVDISLPISHNKALFTTDKFNVVDLHSHQNVIRTTSFPHFGAYHLWNSLPSDIQLARSFTVHKKRLKTCLFSAAFV